jgi:type IV pilus assembly protein PilW
MLTYTTRTRSAHAGMTLIELMVALAIGMFLMIGAVTVFMQGRTTFRVTESLSRLQENARFAIDAMEPDIRMAGFWGLSNVPTNIEGRAGTTAPPGMPAGALTCGTTDVGTHFWVTNLERPVSGTNGSATWPWTGCAGLAPVETGSDTLVVRRVSEDPVLAGRTANTLYVQSNRIEKSQLFVGATLPASPDPTTSQPYRLSVNGYYVSRDNTSNLSVAAAPGIPANTVPSLRMKTLIDGGTIVDREVLAGVQDMQVQFGLDITPRGTDPSRGTIDRFVNPQDALVNHANRIAFRDEERLILAVRIWLLVRAERTERGYVNNTTYSYAGVTRGPFNDGYRRVLVSKTIYLRNTNLR